MTRPLLAHAGFVLHAWGESLWSAMKGPVRISLTRNVFRAERSTMVQSSLVCRIAHTERLPRFQVGILMKAIEPTVPIRAELRLLFPEIQFTEFTSVVFGDLHGN